MILMSVPLSRRWVAKLCRSEWVVTRLPIWARRLAARQADRPPFAYSRKYPQKARQQHRRAFFAPLGALDGKTHPPFVVGGAFRAPPPADTRARRKSRRKRNPIAQARNRLQETHDLLG